jgi:beta-lactamase regulating signal transducer with metallopeptidase domain
MNERWFQFLNGWADLLWQASWQGGLAILLVLLALRLVPQLPPVARCWLWRLAFLKLLAALVWTTPLDLPILPRPPVLQATPPQVVVRYANGVTVIAASPPVGATPEQRPGTGTVVAMSLLLGAWLVGILRVGYRIGSGFQEAARLSRDGVAVDADELIFGGAELARRVGLRRIPPLLFVDDAPGPLLVGLVRPTILLPTALLNHPDPTRLRMVLTHEMAHVARLDLLWSWLPTVGSALFFFHPLVRLACHEWQLAHELACDEQAIRVTGTEPSVYGETLVRVMAQRRVGSLAEPAVIGASSPHLLTRRLLEMNSLRSMSAGKLRVGVAVALALGLVAIPTWRAVAQPNAPDTPPVKLLKQVWAHYQRLDSFSMRLRHQDSNGLFPGKFTQSLEWKKGGRFALKVTERGEAEVPDYYLGSVRK